jgi:septal ring factor EnvC (AmiA/AmiB activator)
MKIVTNVAALAVVGAAAFALYHFLTTGSVSHRLDEQGTRLERVANEAKEQGKTLAEQEKALGAARKDVHIHAGKIEVLEARVATTEQRIEETTREIKTLEEAGGKDRERLSRLEADLGLLRDDYQRSLRDLADLRKETRARNEDFERRLKGLEEKAAVEPRLP